LSKDSTHTFLQSDYIISYSNTFKNFKSKNNL